MITAAMLRANDACKGQVATFTRLFPQGAKVTLPNTRKAQAAGLNLDWAAKKFLTAPAWNLYQETIAQAWKLYDETRDTAWKLYLKTRATAFKLHHETIATASKLYDETAATALRLYRETRATAFVRAWRLMEVGR